MATHTTSAPTFSDSYIRLWVQISAEMQPDIQAAAEAHGVEMMASAATSHGTVRITYAAKSEAILEVFDLWLAGHLQSEPQWDEKLWHRMFG